MPNDTPAPAVIPKADGFAKARAAKAAKRALANTESSASSAEPNAAEAASLHEMLVSMKAKLDAQTAQNKTLAEQVQRLQDATSLTRTPGPEKRLQEFMKAMRPGEQRDGVKEVRDTDILAMEGAYRSGDIVAIKPGTFKEQRWRDSLKHADPIYGQVLQYLGRTKNKRGPRKYKVHFQGIGKDGVTEDELELVKSA